MAKRLTWIDENERALLMAFRVSTDDKKVTVRQFLDTWALIRLRLPKDPGPQPAARDEAEAPAGDEPSLAVRVARLERWAWGPRMPEWLLAIKEAG